jgi:hypothetical protein
MAELDGLLPEDVVLLSAQDDAALARWWSRLNKWYWPELLPHPESPPGVRNFQYTARRKALMRWIEHRIGFAACVAQHRAEIG